MAEGIVAFLTAFIGLIIYLLKKRDASAPQRAEAKEEHATDANLANPDPTALSEQLDRLYLAAGGPARQPRPETGDRLRADERHP